MRTETDDSLIPATVLELYRMKQGELMAAIVHVGARLGLWAALGAEGPCTSERLAAATDCEERWVREWLHAVAAADLVQHDDGTWMLVPEVDLVLNDETHPAHLLGVFGPPMTHTEVDRTVEAFRTGVGMTWDEHGDHTCHLVAALGAGKDTFFVPEVIDPITGMSQRLAAGGSVLDIGCGAGVATCAVAAAYPQARVVGLDPSGRAIAAATERSHERGLSNVSFRTGTFEDLATLAPSDLVLTLDVLHDLPHPAEAIAAVRAHIASDGWWVVADVKSQGDLEANRKIPVLPYMYAMSVFYCMSSALSEPGGAGLGTMGMHAARLEQMAIEGGFSSVETKDLEVDPTERYFLIRP